MTVEKQALVADAGQQLGHGHRVPASATEKANLKKHHAEPCQKHQGPKQLTEKSDE